FQEGRRADALQRMSDLAGQFPASAAARTELARLRAEHERLAQADQAASQAQQLALDAEAALTRDDPQAAMEIAEKALSFAPGHQLALRTSARAHARLRERAEHAGRAERAKRHLQ